MNKKISHFLVPIIFAILVSACKPRWEITLTAEDQPVQTISSVEITFYLDKSTEESTQIPLGQMLYAAGYSLINTISLSMNDGSLRYFEWNAIAPFTTISISGVINISGTEYTPEEIFVTPTSTDSTIQYSIMDIGPTMTNALGLPDLPQASGVNRYDGTAEYGVMVLLDGLQYQELQQLIDSGKLPFFKQHKDAIRQGLTVYPPITTSASAALLTSSPPQGNGVYGYGYRSTATTTLFDLAAHSGKSVIAIEGASLPFNLRNAETTLGGDRDGNGFTDDNVYQNSLDVIESRMPDLLYIHFHEVDDMGHNFGPDSTEYEQTLIRIDGYLAGIYANLPENTLIAIFADHGMHSTGKGGNHGTLTPEDMIIPILLISK